MLPHLVPRRSSSLSTRYGRKAYESGTSPSRAPFNAGTRPGRESFLSAHAVAVTSIQSTGVRPPPAWMIYATGCCTAACMHAAGTKSAIPPPLSHPLSPTLFVSLTVLLAPLCPLLPPLPVNQAAPHRDTIYFAGNGKTNYAVFFEKKEERKKEKKIRTRAKNMNPFPPPFFFFHCYFSLLFHFNLGCVVPPPCSFFSFLFDRSRFLFSSLSFPGFFLLLLLLSLLSFFFPGVPYHTARNNTCWR